MPAEEKVVKYTGTPASVARFKWSVGELIEKFIKELANRKILGGKCPKCGYVHLPPRVRCIRCLAKLGLEDLVELSGKGKLLSHTTVHVDLDGSGNFLDLKEPKSIGAIKLHGSDSTIFMPLGEFDPARLREGLELEAVWREEPKGEISDIKYFRPSES